VLLAIDADVVIPSPSWVSYAPQVCLIGRQPISVPIPAAAGGIPDPALLVGQLDAARRRGLSPKALIVTQPDNPTGTIASRALLEQVTSIARDNNMWVIADEIYRDLTYNPSEFVSVADVAPDITIITSGLSKSLALGGWRIGVLRVPDHADGQSILGDVTAIGSEIWSSMSAPVAGAAKVAYDEPAEIVDYIDRARQLHAKVSRAVFDVFDSSGVPCRVPRAGFYMYPDLEVARDFLHSKGIVTDVALTRYMLDNYQVAVLAGSAFGDDESCFRFRVATSLLYGATTEERLGALDWAATGKLELPTHIAQAIAQLQTMVKEIVHPV
jgi:aspartate aminotransferase